MNGIKNLNIHAKANFHSLKRADPDQTLSSFPAGLLCILYFWSWLTWCHEIEKISTIFLILKFTRQTEQENQICDSKVISILEMQNISDLLHSWNYVRTLNLQTGCPYVASVPVALFSSSTLSLSMLSPSNFPIEGKSMWVGTRFCSSVVHDMLSLLILLHPFS